MRPAGSFEVPAACPPVNGGTEMKESTLAASSRLGGAVISDRVVASLLDELRIGRYAHADRLPAEVDLAAELGVSRTVIRIPCRTARPPCGWRGSRPWHGR